MTPDGRLALLIVEDDPNIRYLLETAARRTGLFEPIESTKDGEEAHTLLHSRAQAELPDMIVTDLSMPRMTGMELLEALKADAAMHSLPIAVITSSDLPNDRERALRAGAFAFLHKPYGLEALTQVLLELRTARDAVHAEPRG